MATIGIDFGTSNTSAAVLLDGRPRLIELEPGRTSVPTAVFLDFGAREMLFGSPAVAALVEGRDGRFLRALKRVLGTPVMREPRQLLNRRTTLVDLVAEVLALVKARAETATGLRFDTVRAGRPVRFQAEPERDVQATADVAQAYRLAGFDAVEWRAEPEAAALACGIAEGTGLVVDIGGGTSDFTVFDARGGRIAIRASHGVRLGGTDADRALSLAHVMPRLGYGGLLHAEFGPNVTFAPQAPFQDMATWEKIGFLQTPEMAREAARWVRRAERPELFARWAGVLEHGLGFDLAFAVEAAKIAGGGPVDLSLVDPGLVAPLDAARMDRDLAELGEAVTRNALEALAAAGQPADALAHVVYVGGSALLAPIRSRIEAALPHALPVDIAAFTAVAEGLALDG